MNCTSTTVVLAKINSSVRIMKTATYQTQEGPKTFQYDPNYPCIICEHPVKDASMSGTAICPWCDLGLHRDGTPWNYRETMEFGKRAIEKSSFQALLVDESTPNLGKILKKL